MSLPAPSLASSHWVAVLTATDGVTTVAISSGPHELDTPTEHVLEPGYCVGPYEVLSRIGKGGMGSVYLAQDQRLERQVALKHLHASLELDLDLLRREAQLLAQLSHPNVVQVYGIEQQDDVVCVAMEYVPGVTLLSWLAAERRDATTIVRAFCQAGEGLVAAHAAGLVHRDFKPANVLFGNDGRLRVLDFGLACAAVDSQSNHPEEASDLAPWAQPGDVSRTAGIILAGTPRFMPPEQHRGDSLDARVDQYAFCVSLWEALAGRRLFAATPTSTLEELKERGLTSEHLRKIPRRYRGALSRGLSPRREDRFASMRELLVELRRQHQYPSRIAAPLLFIPVLGWAAVPSDRLECEAGARQIDDAWNDSTRDGLTANLAGSLHHVEQRARLDTILHEYTTQWKRAFADVCEAKHTVVAALYDEQMFCLRQRKSAFEAQLSSLIATSGVDFSTAIKAVAELEDVSSCVDPERLASEADRHLQPPRELQALVAELRRKHEDVLALRRLGRYEDVVPRAQDLLVSAREVGFEPFINELRLTLLGAQRFTGRTDEAVATAEQLYFDAKEQHQHLLGLDALVELIFILGDELDRPQQARVWLQFAHADLTQHPDRERTGRLLIAEGVLEIANDEPEEAIQRLERALKNLDARSPYLTSAMYNLALCQLELGHVDVAIAGFEDVLQLQTELLGPDHPEHHLIVANLAKIHFLQGDYPTAERLYRRQIELIELGTSGHVHLIGSWSRLAATLAEQDKTDEADAAVQRALSLAPANPTPSTRTAIENARLLRATLWRKSGREQEAQVLLTDLLEETEAAIVRARALHELSLLEIARQDYPQANAWLERAASEIKAAGLENDPSAAAVLATAAALRIELGER